MTDTAVRCFGGIAIRGIDGELEPLRGRTDSTVLALLATDPRGIRVDQLLDAVWASDTRQPLTQSVYRLRRRFGTNDAVRLEGSRYRLDSEVDVWRFADFVERDDTHSLRAGLQLWEGEPFDDIDDCLEIHTARERLRQQRIRAVEQIAEQSTADPVELLPLVRAGAAEEPWNERLTMAAMDAFAINGRSADALDLADECRRRLREDLNVETSPAFNAREAAIRRQQRGPGAVPAPTVGSTRDLPLRPEEEQGERSDRPVLVERFVALEALQRQASSAATGPGRIALVTGAAGVGKSYLVDYFLGQRMPDSHEVRRGRARPGDRIAYEAILEALHELSDSLDLLTQERDASVGRLLFSRDAEELLYALSLEGPATIVIEDLQDLDAASMSLLSYLAARALPAGVTILLTMRDPGAAPERRAEIAALSDRPTVDVLSLPPLTLNGIRQLVDGSWPAARPADRARLADLIEKRSGGIALIVDALIRAAGDDPADEIVVETRHDVTAVHHRGLVDEDDLHLLGLAALIGFDFSLEVLLSLTDHDERDVVATLDRAVQRGILREGDRDDRFQFGHQLVHEEFSIAPSNAARRRAFATLVTGAQGDRRELLRYVRGAGAEISDDVALATLFAGARELRAAAAFVEAHTLLLELERLLPSGDARHLEVLTFLAECASRSGHPDEAAAWRARALPQCRNDADIAALAVSGLPDGEFVAGEPSRLELFDRVPTADEIVEIPSAFYMRSHLRTARLAGDIPRVRSILDGLRPDDFRDDPSGWGELEFERLLIESAHDGRAIHDDLAALAQGTESGPLRAAVLHRQLVAAKVEQRDDIAALLHHVAAEVRMSGSPLAHWGVGQMEVALELDRFPLHGTSEERGVAAEHLTRMITRAHLLAVRLGVTNADAGLAAQTFLQLWNDGRHGAALPIIEAAGAEGTPNPGWMAAAAFSAAAAGDLLRTRHEAERVVSHFAEFEESNWRLNASAVLIEAAWEGNLVDAARAGAAELRDRSGRCVVLGVGSVSLGPVDRYLGKAAALTGDEDPVPLLERALEQAQRTGAVLWAARAEDDLRAVHARRRAVGPDELL